MIVDTHCHLNDERFLPDRQQVIENLQANNIQSAFIVGTDRQSCELALELSHQYDYLFAIVGLYPEYAQQYDANFEAFLASLLADKKVVALGEIGLDFHQEQFDENRQIEVFERQIWLADKFNLPLSIHTREAFEKTLQVLNKSKSLLHGGVIHCFSGSPEVAECFVKLGFKLGFGGVCTFKNAKKVVDTLKSVNSSDILLETDSPYLAPVPHRSERNEPKYTSLVLDKIAEIRGEDRQKLEEQILKNTLQTFPKFKL